MKKQIAVLIIIFLSSCTQGQITDDFYFVAGMPSGQCFHDGIDEIFVSQILEYTSNEGFLNKLSISDSSEVLFSLMFYPEKKKIISLACGKETRNFKAKIIETSDLSIREILLYDTVINHEEYSFYSRSLRPIIRNRSFFLSLEYHNNQSKVFSKRFIIVGNNYSEIGFEDLENVVINGAIAGPFFGSNSDLLPLQAHPTERLLVIPSYLIEESVFHTNIPINAALNPIRLAANVILNTDQVRLLYYYRGEDSKPFYDLYNKSQDRYYQYPFDNSNQNLKQYGDWIAGPSRLQYVDKGTYEGLQPGQSFWSHNDSKFGLSASNYMDRRLKQMILSGYLAIRSINNPSIFIEWNTDQGDSEILFINKDLIYYRKHDEIWYVPILNKKALGEHKLLLKDKVIPSIHFMFKRQK